MPNCPPKRFIFIFINFHSPKQEIKVIVLHTVASTDDYFLNLCQTEGQTMTFILNEVKYSFL